MALAGGGIAKVVGDKEVPIKQKPDGTLYVDLPDVVEQQVMKDLEIRDTDPHDSDIADCRYFNIITVFVDNDLNESVSVQMKGNRVNSVTGAVNIGSAFTVAADDRESRTLTPDTSGWLPYIFVTVTAPVAPTEDAIDVYIIKKPL